MVRHIKLWYLRFFYRRFRNKSVFLRPIDPGTRPLLGSATGRDFAFLHYIFTP
jgi:hypothetical protein